jgi:hypothetical protein
VGISRLLLAGLIWIRNDERRVIVTARVADRPTIVARALRVRGVELSVQCRAEILSVVGQICRSLFGGEWQFEFRIDVGISGRRVIVIYGLGRPSRRISRPEFKRVFAA